MRTEVKFAIVVVLVAVIGAAMYFFSHGNDNIKLETPKPLTSTVTPKGSDIPLPLGPGGSEETENKTQLTPTSDLSSKDEKDDDDSVPMEQQPAKKPVLTINLEPMDTASTTKPSGSAVKNNVNTGATVKETKASGKIVPNQPNAVDLTPLVEENTSDVSSKTPKVTEKTSAHPQADSAGGVHIVKPSETLYSIAMKYYGRGEMWTVIARANKELHPGKIHAGMKLTIPAADKAIPHFDGVEPQKQEKDTKEAKEVKEPSPTGAGKRKLKPYKVEAGDSFYTIARDNLGAGSRWKEIFELNKKKVSKPENIRAGQTIYIPAD